MGGHLDNDRMNAHTRDALPPDELLAVDDHLAACNSCRDQAGVGVELKVGMGSLLRAMVTPAEPAGEHLTYEQLEAHARGSLRGPERTTVEAHLRDCNPCATEAADLADFVSESRAPAEIAPAVAPLDAGPGAMVRGARRWFRTPAFSFALAAALVAAVAVAWLVPASLRRQNRELTARADVLRAEMERLRAEVPVVSGPPVLTLNDDHGAISLDASGELSGLDALSIAEGRLIAAALRTGRVEVPAEVRDLIGSTGVLLGDDSPEPGFRPVAPVGTAVRSGQPSFSWQPLPEATTYAVAVYDSEFNPVDRADSLTRTSWTPSRALKPGAVYLWQVSARRGAEEITTPVPPAPEARFKVLGRFESASLKRALQNAGRSHLAAGILLAHAGCLDDAREELQALIDKNPDSVPARNLLRSVASAGRDLPDDAAPDGR